MAGSYELSEHAPDFELRDTRGHQIRLSDYRGRAVVLAFLRGFL
jgi:peroxiredoxin